MPKSINLTGTAGKSYNLDDLQKNTRTDSSEDLVVQIWEWNPNLPGDHGKPNPPSPELGQIWLSKLVKEDLTEGSPYRRLLDEYSNKAGV